MTIGVSVRTTKFGTRINGDGVRQERSQQSVTNHSANVMGKLIDTVQLREKQDRYGIY